MLPDYQSIQWKPSELVIIVLQVLSIVFGFSYFFYRSILAVLPMTVLGVLFYRSRVREKIKKQEENLELQFKECVVSVATAMRAGYAVENAFRESEQDMLLLYGPDAMICRELALIRRGLILNIPMEELLHNFAGRSNREMVRQFADVFVIAKRSGGDLAEIMQNTAKSIREQVEVRSEIATVLSGRRMEMTIMQLVPFGILGYISLTSPGYFDTLYGNMKGILTMTICLVVYLAAYVLGEKIMQKLEGEMV